MYIEKKRAQSVFENNKKNSTTNMRVVPRTNKKYSKYNKVHTKIRTVVNCYGQKEKIRVIYVKGVMMDHDDKAILQQFKRTMAREQAIRKQLNLPTARYDMQTRRAYLEYPDGRREYVD